MIVKWVSVHVHQVQCKDDIASFKGSVQDRCVKYLPDVFFIAWILFFARTSTHSIDKIAKLLLYYSISIKKLWINYPCRLFVRTTLAQSTIDFSSKTMAFAMHTPLSVNYLVDSSFSVDFHSFLLLLLYLWIWVGVMCMYCLCVCVFVCA